MGMKKETIKELITYLSIILFIILIRTFVITPVRVNGNSMNDTLKDGEILILDKVSYRFNDIKRFDIVVIDHKTEKFIKRVIGLPGETLKIENGNLFINEKLVKEDYLNQKTEDFIYNGVIPDNCYFAMGDNRGDSLDSRYFGCFMKDNIEGKVNFTVFPFSKFGKIN
ncbi:MAG: signal peptidase I [Firmicutes bacterium]|nr:signal peptidase I [Bacillota bacterium]